MRIIQACLEVGPVSAAFVTGCQQLSLYVYFWCLFMACPIRAGSSGEGTGHQKTIDKTWPSSVQSKAGDCIRHPMTDAGVTLDTAVVLWRRVRNFKRATGKWSEKRPLGKVGQRHLFPIQLWALNIGHVSFTPHWDVLLISCCYLCFTFCSINVFFYFYSPAILARAIAKRFHTCKVKAGH